MSRRGERSTHRVSTTFAAVTSRLAVTSAPATIVVTVAGSSGVSTTPISDSTGHHSSARTRRHPHGGENRPSGGTAGVAMGCTRTPPNARAPVARARFPRLSAIQSERFAHARRQTSSRAGGLWRAAAGASLSEAVPPRLAATQRGLILPAFPACPRAGSRTTARSGRAATDTTASGRGPATRRAPWLSGLVDSGARRDRLGAVAKAVGGRIRAPRPDAGCGPGKPYPARSPRPARGQSRPSRAGRAR